MRFGRLEREKRAIDGENSTNMLSGPMPNDLFEWHFTFRGSEGTDYEGGLYHGRILYPEDYPLGSPEIVLLNRNGRFEPGRHVWCTEYDNWHPIMNIRTIIESLRADFLEEEFGLARIQADSATRRLLAQESRAFRCEECGQHMQDVWEIFKAREKEARVKAKRAKLKALVRLGINRKLFAMKK